MPLKLFGLINPLSVYVSPAFCGINMTESCQPELVEGVVLNRILEY